MNQARHQPFTIDVLDQPDQEALVLPTLRPSELIAAILQEFRELETLDSDPATYTLIDLATGAALAEDQELGQQLGSSRRLALRARVRPLPAHAQPSPATAYLRAVGSGRVFKLDWLPALIGRPDPKLPDNDLIAANLEAFPTGLRVSRRHAQIGWRNGQFFIQSLSGNPVSLHRADQQAVAVTGDPCPLATGDTIVLDRSEIALKFLVHDPEPAKPSPPAAALPGEPGEPGEIVAPAPGQGA